MNPEPQDSAQPYAELDRWIDAHHAGQVEFLREIVRVPSDTPPGDNAPAAEKAAELLTGFGFDVERYPVPADFLREYGMKSVTNLIVRHRFGTDGPVIALNAHGDVVPPGDGWTKPPYEGVIENGHMYARGVAVSKSDIATYTYALAALRSLAQSGAVLHGSVELHFTYDEELGGLAGPARRPQVIKPDYAIAASRLCGGHRLARLPATEVNVDRSGHGAMRDRSRRVPCGRRGLTALYGARKDALLAKKSNVRIDHPTMIVGLSRRH
jgi:acetylornithine deacetylase/succinyl-diaminopimelate desuccinylase-like protein